MNNTYKPSHKVNIPEWDLVSLRADRSSGPGGQNVNKTSTKMTLRFSIDKSKILNDEQKKILKEKLASSLTKGGEIVISAQSSRSQWTNRVEVFKKLNEIINDALTPDKERIETKVSQGKIEKRLTEKKKHSEIKRARSKIDFE